MKFKKFVAWLLAGAMLATSVPSSALPVWATEYTADADGWWQSWTPGFEVADGQTRYFSMEVKGGDANWNNVSAVFVNIQTDGIQVPNAGNFPGYQEYAVVRADRWGWSDEDNKSLSGKDIVYSITDVKNGQGETVDIWSDNNFVKAMKDAHIDAAVSKNGDKVTLQYDVKGANGISWTYKATLDQATDEGLYVFFANDTSSVTVEDETKPDEIKAVAVTGDSAMTNVTADLAVTTVPRLCDPSSLAYLVDGEADYGDIAEIDKQAQKITFKTAGTHTITALCVSGEGENKKTTTAETTVEVKSAPLMWVRGEHEDDPSETYAITDNASVYTVNHDYKTGSVETAYQVPNGTTYQVPNEIQMNANLIRAVYGLSPEEDAEVQPTYTYQWYTAADNQPVSGADSAEFVPKDSDGIRYNTDATQYYCIVTLDQAEINGDIYTKDDVVKTDYSAEKTPLTLKYAVNYNYTGITDQSGAQVRDYFSFNQGEENGYTDDDEPVVLPTIDARKEVESVNINTKAADVEKGIYGGASVSYSFAAYDKENKLIKTIQEDKNEAYTNQSIRSGEQWAARLKETVTENDTEVVKDVDHYELNATYYFGKYVIGTSSKKYPVSYDPESITDYLDTYGDSYTFANETITKAYSSFGSVSMGNWITSSDGAKLQAVWTAYASDGSVQVVDQGSIGNYIGSQNYPLVQKFGVKQEDGSVRYVDKRVDHYTQDVSIYYGNTVVKKYTKTYQTVYFPGRVDNGTGAVIGKKDDVTYDVSTRNGEKVELEVFGYTPEVKTPLSYQWYATKDGRTEAIAGAIDSKYIAKLTDYDSVSCQVMITDQDALQKYLEEQAKDNEDFKCLQITDIANPYVVTYRAVETEGYLLLDRAMGEELQSVLGDSAKLFVNAQVDNGYALAYQWQKKGVDKYGNTIYTDIENAASSEYTIAKTTEADYWMGLNGETKPENEDLYRVEITVTKGGEKIDTKPLDFSLTQVEKTDETADGFLDNVVLESNDAEKGENTTMKVVNNTDKFLDKASEWTESADWYKKQEYTLIPKLDKEDCYTVVDPKTYTPAQGEVLVKDQKDSKTAFVYLTAVKKVEDSETTYVPDASLVLPTDILGEAPVVFGDYETYEWTGDKNGACAYERLVAAYWVKAASSDMAANLTVNGTALTIKGKDAAGNILNNDGQEYQAVYKITNKADAAKVSSTVEVSGMISYDSELLAYAKNETVTAEVGSSAKLEVVALDKNETVYPITFQWQRDYANCDWKDIEGATTATLNFDQVKDTDYALYRVLIWDGTEQEKEDAQAAETIYFTLTNGSVYWLTNEKNRYEKSLNDKVQLAVDGVFPEGVSNITYRWYKSGVTAIEPGDVEDWAILNADTNIYSYTLLSEDDFGTYKCVVNYTLDGKVKQSDEFIFEVEKANPGTELQAATARKTWKRAGDSVTYGVRVVSENPDVNKAVADEKVSYTWYVGKYDYDREEYTFKRIYGVDAASYTIDDISFEDGNIVVYCEVESKDEELDWSSRSGYFYTYHYSDIEAEYQTVEGTLGEDVTLEAVFKNPSNRPLTYQWYMGGRKIHGAAGLTYTIRNLGETETKAYYECRAYSGETYEAGCHVAILLPGEYSWNIKANTKVNESDEIVGIIGRPLDLEVVVETEDKEAPELTYRWTKDGAVIEGAVSPKLSLDKLSVVDGGTYICQAVDKKGKRESVSFDVAVSTGLTVDSGYPDPDTVQAYETAIGDAVTLRADAGIESEGYDIFYQWYRGYQCNPEDAIYDATGSELALTDLAEDDLGYYCCEVSDNRGKTAKLYYYVYVDTGLVIEQSVYRPTEDADGSVTMFADVKANVGETLEIAWHQFGKEDKKGEPVDLLTETIQADGEFYRTSLVLPEIIKDALGTYWVEVKTSGEFCAGEYLLAERYELTSNVGAWAEAYVEQGAAVRFDMKLINAAKDAEYTYQWYAQNPVTGGLIKDGDFSAAMVEQNVKTASYESTAPKLPTFGITALCAPVDYSCVVSRDGEVQNVSWDEEDGSWYADNIYTLNIFAKLSTTTSLPETAHPFDKEVSAVKYVKSGAKELKLTFDLSDADYEGAVTIGVVGKDGSVKWIDSTNRTVIVPGEYAIIFIHNEGDNFAHDYGYKVTSAIDTYGAKVTLANKSAAYTGKAIAANTANVTGSKGKVTYSYYSDAACTKKLSGAPVNVGTYYVKATAAADSNYRAATSAAARLVITKAASTVTLKAKTASYTGKAISVSTAAVNGSKGKVTYTYYTDAKCTKKTTKKAGGASMTGAAPKNAGTYYVKASVAADNSYLAATGTAVKLVIKRAASKVTLKAKKAAYTGKAVKIGKATVKGSKGKVTYTYYTDAKCTKKTAKKANGASKAGAAPKKAGTYYVKATVAAKGGYAKAVSKAVKLVITK